MILNKILNERIINKHFKWDCRVKNNLREYYLIVKVRHLYE